MEELKKFEFGTIVCDGCGRRIDSHVDDEILHDIDALTEWVLEDYEWEKQPDAKWLCPDCAKDPKHRIHPGEGRTIIDRMSLSGLRCDLCGCQFENYEGFSCWADSSATEEKAREDDWIDIDGKMLCPDCWKTCAAMEDEEEENYEEVYCSKCSHQHDCNEAEVRNMPEASNNCTYAFKSEDGKWHRCPHFAEGIKNLKSECNLPEGEKCPRILQWEKDKPLVEQKNKEIVEWANNKD